MTEETVELQTKAQADEHFPDEAPPADVPAFDKFKKYIFSILFMLALLAVTYYVIFKDASVNDIFAVLRSANIWWVLAGFGAIILCRLTQALVIKMSARCVGYRISFGEAVQYAMVNVFYSGITPSSTGGQPMQIFYLCRDRMNASGATLTIFSVNITFQISMVLVSLGALTYLWNYVAATARGLFVLFGIGFVMHIGLLLLLMTIVFSEKNLRGIVNFGMRMGKKLRLIKSEDKARRSIDKYIAEVKQGNAVIKTQPWKFVGITGVTILQVLFYHTVPFFIYKAFGMTTGFSIIDLMAISAFLFVSVSFLPLPGTVGASERGFVVLYRTVFPGHVLAATVLSRLVNVYIILLLAGLISIYIQIRKPHNIAARTRKKQKTQ